MELAISGIGQQYDTEVVISTHQPHPKTIRLHIVEAPWLVGTRIVVTVNK